jgi:glycosyltransferase involved in cell wall biosynthesis
MTSSPRISIITTFLNAERFIAEAIESVLSQRYTDWDLVMVDDGSSDATPDIVRKYAASFDRIRYEHHDGYVNRGMSASRNVGVGRSNGSYVAFLDADDVWLPDKLTEQLAILDAHPEAAMVYGSTQYWFGWSDHFAMSDYICDIGIEPDTVIRPPQLLNLMLGSTHTPCPSDILIRREVIERIGGFEEAFVGPLQLYEDQALLAKVYLDEAVFVSNRCWDKYRIHDQSCDSVVTRAGRHREVREFFLNWLENYLKARRDQYLETAELVHDALAALTSGEQSDSGGETRRLQWWLRVGSESAATLSFLDRTGDAVRIGVERTGAGLSHDIQLNEARLKISRGYSYLLVFDARAAEHRSINVGCSQAYPPWGNLGLYRRVEIGTDWQHVELCFDALADALNARIHFDVGEHSTSVELRRVRLRQMPDGSWVDPDIPGFRQDSP